MTAGGSGRTASATFVNLPVADLKRSMVFFEAPGFALDSQFTDDTAACLVLGSSHYAMLVTGPRFKGLRPAEDHGWMYGRVFQDLDGHIWEPFFMDVEAMRAATLAAND